jgi:hypothetical protein
VSRVTIAAIRGSPKRRQNGKYEVFMSTRIIAGRSRQVRHSWGGSKSHTVPTFGCRENYRACHGTQLLQQPARRERKGRISAEVWPFPIGLTARTGFSLFVIDLRSGIDYTDRVKPSKTDQALLISLPYRQGTRDRLEPLGKISDRPTRFTDPCVVTDPSFGIL